MTRINRTIHQAAAARGLPVAEVSAHFLPPWSGKFASDRFHPSQDGYRDWARALLATVPRSRRSLTRHTPPPLRPIGSEFNPCCYDSTD